MLTNHSEARFTRLQLLQALGYDNPSETPVIMLLRSVLAPPGPPATMIPMSSGDAEIGNSVVASISPSSAF